LTDRQIAAFDSRFRSKACSGLETISLFVVAVKSGDLDLLPT
jgi:hypothetical protein